MNRYFIETPFGQMHYIDAGRGNKEPIIMIHKCPRSSDEYADIIPILSEKYRTVAIDMIGYGDSDKPTMQLSVEDYVSNIRLLMDSLDIPCANIVGHLSGSIQGIELAASSPDRVKKLILSGPIFMDAEARENRKDKWPQWKIKPDGMHMMDFWQERLAIVSGNRHLIHRLVLDVLKAGETSEYAHYANAVYKMEERLPLVKCPVLLIVGKKDPYVYPQKVHMFKQILPDTTEVLLEDGGYFIPDEMPETFARLVQDFVEKP